MAVQASCVVVVGGGGELRQSRGGGWGGRAAEWSVHAQAHAQHASEERAAWVLAILGTVPLEGCPARWQRSSLFPPLCRATKTSGPWPSGRQGSPLSRRQHSHANCTPSSAGAYMCANAHRCACGVPGVRRWRGPTQRRRPQRPGLQSWRPPERYGASATLAVGGPPVAPAPGPVSLETVVVHGASPAPPPGLVWAPLRACITGRGDTSRTLPRSPPPSPLPPPPPIVRRRRGPASYVARSTSRGRCARVCGR